MIQESRDVSYYDVLDVRKNATPEAVREAYVRAKNAFANDSLATYSLFDKSQSKKMLEEIECAYNILSDPEKRKAYDHAHGFIRSTEEFRPVPSLILENGEEVSEVGLKSQAPQAQASFSFNQQFGNQPAIPPRKATPLENLFFSGDAQAAAEPTPTQSEPSFAERFTSQNNDAKKIDPNTASKNFIPNTSMNPNAHFIHKRFETNTDTEELLKQAEAVDGNFLRMAREYKRVTQDEIMEFTKLSRRYIEALETDAVDRLPAPVFVRGFVIQYAKSLQLDANRVASSYMRNFQSLREARGLR